MSRGEPVLTPRRPLVFASRPLAKWPMPPSAEGHSAPPTPDRNVLKPLPCRWNSISVDSKFLGVRLDFQTVRHRFLDYCSHASCIMQTLGIAGTALMSFAGRQTWLGPLPNHTCC